MKKLIAVMAFAGVLSVPSVLLADANWYGSLRGGVEFGGGEDASFKDGGSRWGIKGSNEVSEGLSAVYRFEAKINSASATQVGGDRLSYVGLSGGFGNLTLGRVGAAGAKTGGILDNSFHYGNSYTGFRTGNAISYAISTGGVSAQLDAIMNADQNSGSAIDEMQLGLSLSLGDVGKIAFSHVQTEDYTETTTVAASHTHADFMTDTIVLRPGMTTYEDYMLTAMAPKISDAGELEVGKWTYGTNKEYKKENVTAKVTAYITTSNGAFVASTDTTAKKVEPMIVKVRATSAADVTGTLIIGATDATHYQRSGNTYIQNGCATAATCVDVYRYAAEYQDEKAFEGSVDTGYTVHTVEDNKLVQLGPEMVAFTNVFGNANLMVSGTAPGDESTSIKSVTPTMVIDKDDEYEMQDGDRELTVVSGGEDTETAASKTPTKKYGQKKNTVAAEFGLGGITAFVGYTQVESNMKDAVKDKITHYGIRGGLGDSGVNFLVQLRSEDLKGSKPMDADRDPYVVNLSKSLGDGASAYIEHGTGDAKGEKAATRIGMIVNF